MLLPEPFLEIFDLPPDQAIPALLVLFLLFFGGIGGIGWIVWVCVSGIWALISSIVKKLFLSRANPP